MSGPPAPARARRGRRRTPLVYSLAELRDGRAWVRSRNSHTPPRHVSTFDGCQPHRAEFLLGMEMLGFDRAQPQQLVVADALAAVDAEGLPWFDELAMYMPRRSSKSTSLQAVILGRCHTRSRYLVGYSFATTLTKVEEKFKDDVLEPLEAWAVETYGEDKRTWPFKISRRNGALGVRWKNGSRFRLVTANSAGFRSEAFDMVVVDEAGEADPKNSQRIIQALNSTMDTRDEAQLVIVGTSADFRDGNLLWESLERGRAGEAGIVDYSAAGAEDLTVDDLDTWEKAAELVASCHPGVGPRGVTLTNLAKLEKGYRRQTDKLKWAAEYLGRFGVADGAAGLLIPAKWNARGRDVGGEFPEPPAEFSVAFCAAHRSQAGSVVAAWRAVGGADDGAAVLVMLDHQAGVDWMAGLARDIQRAHRRARLVYDKRHSPTRDALAELLKRDQRGARLHALDTADVGDGTSLLRREVHAGSLIHYEQEELTAAALLALERKMGEKAIAAGRPDADADISGIEAAILALQDYDTAPRRPAIPNLVN